MYERERERERERANGSALLGFLGFCVRERENADRVHF